MNSQKISVIIPTYNRPGFLSQAVHSVLAQTLPVFEIIIVDDGSFPMHHPSLFALEALDERIRVYSLQENRGVSAARNYGLEKSTGDFVLFLDDDDLLHREMMRSCMEKFGELPDTDVVACWYGIFYDKFLPEALDVDDSKWKDKPRSILYTQKYASFPSIEKKPLSALLQINLQISSCLIKKKSLNGVRFFEELERGEDRFFWITLAGIGCRIKVMTECLVYYRIHPFTHLSQFGTVSDFHKLYKNLLARGVIRQKQDLIVMHFQYSMKLRSSDRLGSLYHAALFIKYFLQPSAFKVGFYQLLRLFKWKFCRQQRRLKKVRALISAARVSRS